MSGEQKGLSYRDAGVDIDAADAALARIKESVRRTFDNNVMRNIGSFGAMYKFPDGKFKEPVLVSSVDGVGTKLKVAFMMNKHDTVGIDLVSHCVNDILVQGAKPLFFLDYLACGKLEPNVVADVIGGLANGCRYANCALIGGETAEMPDMYHPGEYDVAGTIVGLVDRERIIDGSTIQEGDVIIALESSGLHTNGYSLARKIFFEVANLTINAPLKAVGRSVGEALLEPHRSYARVVDILTKIVTVKGMVHVTGGGITDNLPRTLPAGLGAEIDCSSWVVPPLFTIMRDYGHVADKEMLRTFNMGLGYLIIVSKAEEEQALNALRMTAENPITIGRVVSGDHSVNYTGTMNYAPSN